MSEHTQGRLSVTPPDDDDYAAAIMGPDCDPYPLPIADVHSEGNARRLVACWNVCDGLSTEVLESILTMGNTMKSGFAIRDKVEQDMAAQRDELLKALKLCEGNISSLLASQHPKVFGTWLEVVRSAIAKATGGQT